MRVITTISLTSVRLNKICEIFNTSARYNSTVDRSSIRNWCTVLYTSISYIWIWIIENHKFFDASALTRRSWSCICWIRINKAKLITSIGNPYQSCCATTPLNCLPTRICWIIYQWHSTIWSRAIIHAIIRARLIPNIITLTSAFIIRKLPRCMNY